MVKDKLIIKRILKAYRAVVSAWWVFLIIIVYYIIAWRLFGTGCVLASTIGFPCPGCGATRALAELIKGNFISSLYFHPLLIPSVILIFIYFFLWLTRESMPKYLDKFLIVYVIIVVALFIVRMVLMFPNHPPLNFNYNALLPTIIRFITSMI